MSSLIVGSRIKLRPPSLGLLVLSAPPHSEKALYYGRLAAEELRKKHLNIVFSNQVITKRAELKREIETLLPTVDCIVLLISSLLDEELISSIEEIPAPIVIWDPNDPATLSLPSSMSIRVLLEEKYKSYKFIIGKPEERQISQIASYARACRGLSYLRSLRLGILGGFKSEYLYQYDLQKISRIFNIKPISLDNHLVIEYAEKLEESVINDSMRKLTEAFTRVKSPPAYIIRALRLYLALKRIVKEYELNALLLNCGREIRQYSTYCLALSLLSSEGFPIDCNADLYGILSIIIAYYTTGRPAFSGFINGIEFHDRILRIINCGAAPLNLAPDLRDIVVFTQKEDIGKGVSLSFSIKRSRVTLLRLIKSNSSFSLLITSGDSFPVPRERLREDIEIWPHAFIKLDSNPSKLLSELKSNRIHIILGDYRRDLIELCNIMKLEPVLI